MTQIDANLIRQLFPRVTDGQINTLLRGQHVDFLIGMTHPSWHPEKAERAQLGGDFWIFRGMFGSSIGGRHPSIQDNTKKSSSLFTVNHVYHNNGGPVDSHALEYCENRVVRYRSGARSLLCPVGLESSNVDIAKCTDNGASENPIASHAVPTTSVKSSENASTPPSVSFHQAPLISDENRFFEAEALGTIVEPKCGS